MVVTICTANKRLIKIYCKKKYNETMKRVSKDCLEFKKALSIKCQIESIVLLMLYNIWLVLNIIVGISDMKQNKKLILLSYPTHALLLFFSIFKKIQFMFYLYG